MSMIKSKWTWLLCCILFMTHDNHAQNVRIKATLDTAQIEIGEQIRLKLQAVFDPQLYRVNFPVVPDSVNHLEFVTKQNDTIIGRSEQTISQSLTITSFDSGRWLIPAFRFDIQPLNGTAASAQWTDSLYISVGMPIVDTSKPFKPIKGIQEAKMPWKELIWYIVGIVLLLGVLIFLIIYLVKNAQRKKKVVETPVVRLNPFEQAMQDLNQLEKQELWQQNQAKAYHTQINDIIRQYLESTFEYDCFEKTSNEIIQMIRKDKGLKIYISDLKWIFETADMVKFAKSQPGEDEHIRSMQLTRTFIEQSYSQFVKKQETAAPKSRP